MGTLKMFKAGDRGPFLDSGFLRGPFGLKFFDGGGGFRTPVVSLNLKKVV